MENLNELPREEKEIHLRDYWKVIWRGRWTAISIFLVVFAIVAIGTFVQTPIYRATATVEIQPEARRILQGQEAASIGSQGYGWFAEEKYHNTQLEIIKSRNVSEKAFDQLGLKEHKTFKNLNDPIKTFMSMVKVGSREDTGIVEISMEGASPREITEWINAVAEEYVRRNVEIAVEGINNIVEEMIKNIGSLRQQLSNSQQDHFKEAMKEQILVPEKQKDIINNKLSSYNEQLAETQIKLSKLKGTIQTINEIERNNGDFMTLPDVADDRTIQDLIRRRIELEQEIEKLKISLKPGHPQLKQTNSELEKIEEKTANQIGTIIAKLKNEHDLELGKERYLKNQIRKTEEEALKIGQETFKYDVVKTDAETKKKIYDAIIERMNQISLSAQLLPNNITILDKAITPQSPIKPRKMINLAAGILLGLMLGIGAVFFLDYLDNTIKSTEDIEQYLKLSLLSIIPKFKDSASHAIKESLQTLRTSIIFSSNQRKKKILLVTSAGPKEGKSSTLVHLAKTMASAGDKVAIVDCDLRRPTVHTFFDLDREHGLTNYLASLDAEHYSQFMKNSEIPNLSVMTCGPIPPNPPELFSQERFSDLLAVLKNDFDWIFLDSPPVVSLTDSIILSSVSDMVAIVIRHNENDKELIRRSIYQIKQVNGNVIGVILNNVDIERAYYKDYYYAGYYYYTEDGDKKKQKVRKAKDTEGAGQKILKS
jgi:capsular exopolysaccharide synthesis family protein